MSTQTWLVFGLLLLALLVVRWELGQRLAMVEAWSTKNADRIHRLRTQLRARGIALPPGDDQSV